MKVMLVYPTPPRGAWPRGIFYSQWVPAGLSQMAGELLAAGHDVTVHLRERVLVDSGFDWAEADRIFLDQVRAFRPDIVGLSVATAAVTESARLANLAREATDGRAIVIAGGPHPTAEPFETLSRYSEFDALVIGEGERTMVDLAANEPLDAIAGLALRKGDAVILTPPRGHIQDIDTLAQPAWGLFDMNFHTRPTRWMLKWLKLRCLNIRTSRGCPNVCSFCAGHVTIGAGVRLHGVDYILEQLHRAVADYEIEAVLFEDETFASNRKRLFELCARLRTEGLADKLRWAASLRVDQADEEVLAEMKSAGCIQVEYGFESGSDHALGAVAKNATVAMNRRAVELTRRAGLRIFADILFNLPGETAEDFEATVAFLRWSRPEVVSAVLLSPLPGTKIYNELSDTQKARFRPEATAYHEYPEDMINLSAMSDEEMARRYRTLKKYLLKPLIHRQLLRDCAENDGEFRRMIRQRCAAFALKHPIRALRLPV